MDTKELIDLNFQVVSVFRKVFRHFLSLGRILTRKKWNFDPPYCALLFNFSVCTGFGESDFKAILFYHLFMEVWKYRDPTYRDRKKSLILNV